MQLHLGIDTDAPRPHPATKLLRSICRNGSARAGLAEVTGVENSSRRPFDTLDRSYRPEPMFRSRLRLRLECGCMVPAWRTKTFLRPSIQTAMIDKGSTNPPKQEDDRAQDTACQSIGVDSKRWTAKLFLHRWLLKLFTQTRMGSYICNLVLICAEHAMRMVSQCATW